MKLNIAIFINTLLSGGAEKQAVLLAKYLKDKHKVTLVVWKGDFVEKKFLENRTFNVILLRGGVLKKISSFYSYTRSNNTDIIFSYLLLTNLINAILGKVSGVTYRVGGIRNAYLEPNKEKIQRFIHNYLNTHTIFNNKRGIENLSHKGFRKEKCYYIGNCFEIEKREEIQPNVVENNVINLITVGRFVEQKDYPTAINLANALREKKINFKYTLIGFGELELNIRQLIETNNLSEYVELVINPDNINDYYKKANLYICTSLFEGLSNTVMEAVYFKLPIIATNVGDNDLLVKNGFNGFLVDIGDYKKMAGHLIDLTADLKQFITMGENSRLMLEENFTQNIFQANYLKFIENLSAK